MPEVVAVSQPITTALYRMMAPLPAGCLVGALLTDLAYWGTAEMIWADFSAWLLLAGLLLGLLVTVLAVLSYIFDPTRRRRALWIPALCYALALLLSILNMFVHSRDAWTSVVPTGLVLSAIVVALLVCTGIIGFRDFRRVEAFR
jgi:uncharacterized membrane protein